MIFITHNLALVRSVAQFAVVACGRAEILPKAGPRRGRFIAHPHQPLHQAA